jgi:hypothetical protein
MKAKVTLRIVAVLAVLVLVTMISDFLALHDIFNDYVSPKVLHVMAMDGLSFPEWTLAPLEWKWVEIMFATRLVLISGILYFIGKMMRSYQVQ